MALEYKNMSQSPGERARTVLTSCTPDVVVGMRTSIALRLYNSQLKRAEFEKE